MKRPKIQPRYIPLLATIVVFLGLYLLGVLSFRGFGSLYVFLNLFGDNAFLGIAAVGATFVILSGGIDLSIGSMIAFTGMFAARALSTDPELGWGWHPAAVIPACMFLGALFGTVCGSLIHFYKLPPFLVTLAGMFFARGMAYIIRDQSLGIEHPFFRETVINDLAIPMPGGLEVRFVTLCMLAVVLAGLYLAHCTRFGRNVYAIGGNEQSATLMGLPVARTKVLIYTFAGLCSSLAGIVYTFDLQKGDPLACVGLELDAIACVVIGGTLLTGGSGFVAGTVFGVLVYGLIKNLIDFHGRINSWWTSIIIGILLLAFILLQKLIGVVGTRRRSA